MSDRATELRALAEEISKRDGVQNAWTAKSFTDRLFVVEVPAGETIAEAVEEKITAHGCAGAQDVYEMAGADDPAFAGELEEGRRYRFVDVETRGEHQSYVVR
jgi:hypothetical protein